MPEVSWKVWEELRSIRKRCKESFCGNADLQGAAEDAGGTGDCGEEVRRDQDCFLEFFAAGELGVPRV